jgi:hypothetical protein
MTIPATYENGVFKPLENVTLTEGTRVEVHLPSEEAPKRPKSVREFAAFGMWADRDDIPDKDARKGGQQHLPVARVAHRARLLRGNHTIWHSWLKQGGAPSPATP